MNDRFNDILNQLAESLEAAQKTYKGQKRSDLKDSDFLFPETRSFPIVTPQDVPDAISNFGRMKGGMSYDAFLKKLYNKIKNKPAFVAALPESSKDKLGLRKSKAEESDTEQAALIPTPVMDPPSEDTVNPNPIVNTNLRPELKDQETIDEEVQKMRDKIEELVPPNPNPDGYVLQGEGETEAAVCKINAGDMVRNINESCMHYGSEGVVNDVKRLPGEMGNVVFYKATNGGKNWSVGQTLAKTPDQLEVVHADFLGLLNPSMQNLLKRQPLMSPDEPSTNDMIAEMKPSKEVGPPIMEIKELSEDEEDKMENEMEDENDNEMEDDSESEMDEYKKDFFEMSVGSLRAIATHATEILNSLENPRVKENLTESWLQGKIAVTEDYMRTIHDFIMYVSEAADNVSAAERPGLWENIRRKRQKMGKKYKPAKPGDKDRPNSEQWNRLTK